MRLWTYERISSMLEISSDTAQPPHKSSTKINSQVGMYGCQPKAYSSYYPSSLSRKTYFPAPSPGKQSRPYQSNPSLMEIPPLLSEESFLEECQIHKCDTTASGHRSNGDCPTVLPLLRFLQLSPSLLAIVNQPSWHPCSLRKLSVPGPE